ncbi:DUF742 domain-containing protein [Amycolatopsis taiwanensis]|uniref:DUF742 domain-containing protein n=1 Tax=Amycolatopsis taiwanensis TaxID=342230 RepID=A0A9W6R054_9PSEU|nr:DUF742 domain-containing protein [Amycolatopsis taiwanensis]GLY65878.1 hypothetical protein Atai01_24970 [Amycolatopsis taiwanensis]
MTPPEEEHFESGDELWERPYTVTGGRTKPSTQLDMMSLVRATGQGRVAPERLGLEHAQALRLCRAPTSVAEIAAHLRQPVMVAKVVLSDLIESGAVTARFPAMFDPPDPTQLKALVDALRKL